MQNSLAILVLSPGVFDLPPVAVITGPDGAQPNVNVSLNGAKSYHQDPEKSVVEWLWDFDKSDRIDWNKPDAVGQNVTKVDGWSAPDGERTVFVSLRVKDNSDPPMYDTEEHKIIITGDVNHPPIADAGGPYAARPGEEIILDGTGSYDPDPGDSISAYAWDLDGDGEYDDSDDPQPSIIWEGVKSGLIGLKVWDQDNLNSSDEAPVYVEVWTSEKDLAVTGEGLEVSNVRPEPGEMITLTVTGQYTSDDEAELDIAKVRFYNGNPDSSYIHIEDYILENLSSGDNFKITVPWTVPEGFKSSVWVKLDFDDQVMEFEETNNTDFLGLEVSGTCYHDSCAAH